MSLPLESTLSLPTDHPIFAGHFPEHPIVPGALILDEVTRVLSEHTGTGRSAVRSAKFVHPARPGQRLRIALTPTASGGFDFRVTSGDILIASGAVQAG